jgi:hypothetical protein
MISAASSTEFWTSRDYDRCLPEGLVNDNSVFIKEVIALLTESYILWEALYFTT